MKRRTWIRILIAAPLLMAVGCSEPGVPKGAPTAQELQVAPPPPVPPAPSGALDEAQKERSGGHAEGR